MTSLLYACETWTLYNRHAVRMDETRIPKQLIYCELTEGNRHQGRPKLRYKDCIKSTLKSLEIPFESWEEVSMNRQNWRRKIHEGAISAESRRRQEAEDKRKQRKAKTSARTIPFPDSDLKYPVCGRSF